MVDALMRTAATAGGGRLPRRHTHGLASAYRCPRGPAILGLLVLAAELTREQEPVTIDQCKECRGIFLDRGELDRLIDAESSDTGPRPISPATATAMTASTNAATTMTTMTGVMPSRGNGGKRRRGGFLSELFD